MYSDEYLCILIATIFQLEKYYEGSHMMEQCVCAFQEHSMRILDE